MKYCTWTWTTQSGNAGFTVTGPNGNSIFLPAAGHRAGTTAFYSGFYGDYWTAAPNGRNTHRAIYFYFGRHLEENDLGTSWFPRDIIPKSV